MHSSVPARHNVTYSTCESSRSNTNPSFVSSHDILYSTIHPLKQSRLQSNPFLHAIHTPTLSLRMPGGGRHLPHADHVISVSRVERLTISTPRKRNALRRRRLVALRDNLRLQLLNNALILQVLKRFISCFCSLGSREQARTQTLMTGPTAAQSQ